MRRVVYFLAGVVSTLSLTGCVERRFLIESDPPGAVVYQNGQVLGATPRDVPFTYYGNHEFTLVKDGYETTTVRTRVRPPWFQYLPLDFVSENLYPLHIQDNRRLRFEMRPLPQPNTTELIQQAGSLRDRGRAIPTPAEY
jgi:hypothetical protein